MYAQAIEGKTSSGMPNGVFTVSKSKAKELTYEVLSTHLGFDSAKADAHNAKYFDKVWEYMDVNHIGALDAGEMNMFMRRLCKPVAEFIHLEWLNLKYLVLLIWRFLFKNIIDSYKKLIFLKIIKNYNSINIFSI